MFVLEVFPMRPVMIVGNIRRFSNRAIWLALTLFSVAWAANAQSTDISAPSAVRSNEVFGTIVARDIGDARLTDHYYAFTGTPGDLLVTVQSNNLNGDVDVFTAAGLRPLMKFSVYAGSSSPGTKSIFLRNTENLILRIEARTPNDDPGTYRLRFGGAFEPITTGPLVAEAETAPAESPTITSSGTKKGRRVSSVGARIDEPPEPEVAAAPTPEPETAEAKPVESPSPPEAKPETSAPARRGRGRRPPGRRTRTPQPATAEESTAKTETKAKPTAEEVTETEPKPAPRGRRSGRRGAAARQPTETAQEPEVESGPRLVIETDDGTLIDRYMSGVRRVTVENGVVVVVGKDGKIQRVSLANILRMSIAP
ncbi:MAG: hypothetical protein M3539_03015 [Acidobacteriota bacterium]|nr:hypothetical protein [Acidobacteriota bacterium]